jgi:hypothetical protein
MLLQFDSSIKDFDDSCLRQGRALETILGAFQANQHVIFIEMDDCRLLQRRAEKVISVSSRIALRTLMNRAVEYQSLLGIIEYKIVVYLENEKQNGVVRLGNVWHVPLQYFSLGGLLQSTILGENDLDAELFIHFARLYQYNLQLSSFLLAGRPKSGGGSGTPKVLTNYLRHEYSPCLCVTDSDKLHPRYQQSGTSRNCSRASQIRNRVVEYISLEEREIENLIPLDLLKKLIPTEGFLREFNSYVLDGDDFWKYIDIKAGVSLKWVQKRDPVTQEYWKKAAVSLARRKKNCKFCKAADGKEEGNACYCSKIEGLGNEVLQKVVAYMEASHPKFASKLLQADTRWEKLGQIVFDFAIAPKGEMLQ